jgi:hypothetical protein
MKSDVPNPKTGNSFFSNITKANDNPEKKDKKIEKRKEKKREKKRKEKRL